MNLFSRYTIGIDIKNDSAAIVALQSSFQDVKLAGHEIFVLDTAKPIGENLAHLALLVKNFITKRKISEPEVLIAVPREKTIIREITFPLSVKENLSETMRYEVEKYVPFSVNEIYFDCQVTFEDKKENKLHALLAVIKKEDLDPYLALQKELGSGVNVIETSSTALAFGIGDENLTSCSLSPCLFMYQEEDKVQCNLLTGHHLLSSHILGYSDTQDNSKELGSEVESICSRHNISPGSRTLIYIDTEDSQKILASLADGKDWKLTALTLPQQLPATNLLIAYFLALKGQKQPTGHINLLPEGLRRLPSKTSLYISISLLVIIFLLIVGLAGSLVSNKRSINRQLQGEISRLNKEIADLPQLEDNLDKIQSRIDYLATADQGSTRTLDILNELSLLIPDTAWVTKFYLSENSVRIEGSAESASELIEALESSQLFEDAAFLTTVRKGRDDKERFKIGFTINTTGQ